MGGYAMIQVLTKVTQISFYEVRLFFDFDDPRISEAPGYTLEIFYRQVDEFPSG